jgi:hypothetical protein
VGAGAEAVDVGAGVTTGVGPGVARAVGSGVTTGVGFGVGAGVAAGAGVTTGVGAGVGAKVGTGVGVVAVGSVSSNIVEAMIPPPFGPDFVDTPDTATLVVTVTAASACRPSFPVGTRNATLKPPPGPTDVDGSPAEDPSHTSWMLVLTGKWMPTIATSVPAAPLEGDVEMVGVPALVTANGSVIARRTRTIAVVAAQSRQGVRFDARGAPASSTQRVPSQKDMRWLHSAARLTQ